MQADSSVNGVPNFCNFTRDITLKMKERRKEVKGPVLFAEVQKMGRWFALVIMFSANFLIGFLLVRELFFNSEVAIEGIVVLASIFALVLGITLAMMQARLDLAITLEGVYFRYFPFQRPYVFVPFASISEMYVRKYDAFSEYGGTGIKGRRSNISYSINSSEGLQIVLKDSSRILIGTEMAEDLKDFLSVSPVVS
jgi:hypothetical protein